MSAGKFTVKSCGNAHAWCLQCRPRQAEALRKPKRPRLPHEKPCRNCGMCNTCIGLTAPEGMKVCRRCGEARPIEQFHRSGKGRVRNSCGVCRNSTYESLRCVHCNRVFWRGLKGTEVHCHDCRPLVGKACGHCGSEFVGSFTQRRYCSPECRDAKLAQQRAAAHARNRDAALRAYSTGPEPSCSCCGEGVLTFLALDHIDGGGGRHRRETGGGGFYLWLKKNGYPPGFRILCHNCNLGRQINGGMCPHDALVRELLEVS